MTPEMFFRIYDFSHNIEEYFEYMDGINEDNGPVVYYARGQYEVNWLDDDNKKENEKRRSVRGDIKNKKEAGCDYMREWVEWLNTDEDSPWSKDPVGEKTTKLTFKDEAGLTVQTIEDREFFTLSPDFADRGERPSVIFCQCLEAFAEKTYNKRMKESFFKKDSVGEKWSSFETLKSLEPWVKVARDTHDIRGHFSLNDKTVKNYPIYVFEIFEKVFFKELELKEPKEEAKGFKFSVGAQEFVPGAVMPWGSREEDLLLQRCAPKKILGVHQVEQEKPKMKPPSKRRPRTSSKNSTQHVSWQQKDNAFQELNEKMDKIIQGLDTPVIQAHQVV
jgi:hypothetical protein